MTPVRLLMVLLVLLVSGAISMAAEPDARASLLRAAAEIDAYATTDGVQYTESWEYRLLAVQRRVNQRLTMRHVQPHSTR